jgi:hypothetical protein
MPKFLFQLALLLVVVPKPALARTIAVLEFRAGVRAAARISTGMAEQLERLTSHKVISPAEARRRLGPAMDGEVARCSGEPACIGSVGRRLGCDEVILVGLSELGDLIVAIQRIDASGQVLARLADSLQRRRRISKQQLVSYLRRLLPPTDFKRYGQIVVHSAKDGDEVFLDGALQGRAPLPPLRVSAPARYEVKVTRPGHEPFIARLDVLPDATVEVTPTLSRKTKPLKWYQHWWVWALVGGVAAGTATAVAAVSLSRGPDSVPAVIRLGP